MVMVMVNHGAKPPCRASHGAKPPCRRVGRCGPYKDRRYAWQWWNTPPRLPTNETKYLRGYLRDVYGL